VRAQFNELITKLEARNRCLSGEREKIHPLRCLIAGRQIALTETAEYTEQGGKYDDRLNSTVAQLILCEYPAYAHRSASLHLDLNGRISMIGFTDRGPEGFQGVIMSSPGAQ